MQVVLQGVPQVAAHIPDQQAALGAGLDLEDPQRVQHVGEDHELVVIHLGQDGVQVHGGTHTGNLQGQDRADRGFFVGKELLGDVFNGFGGGPLGDADGHNLVGEVQHVAALQRVVLGAVGVKVDLAAELGVILEDVTGKDRLLAAGHGVHPVDGCALTDGLKGVPGEVEVGHGLQNEIVLPVQHGGQGELRGSAQLPEGDAGHGLEDQLLVVGDGEQILIELTPVVHIGREGDELLQKLLPQAGIGLEGLGGQVLQVNHLGARLPQHLGKPVMLLLGNLQIGNVVEQQPVQRTGSQMLQLLTGPMQHHTFQRGDLTFYIDRHKTVLLCQKRPYFHRYIISANPSFVNSQQWVCGYWASEL